MRPRRSQAALPPIGDPEGLVVALPFLIAIDA
jgi:hypothetical protein